MKLPPFRMARQRAEVAEVPRWFYKEAYRVLKEAFNRLDSK